MVAVWSGGVPRSVLASVPVLVLVSVLILGNYFGRKFDFGIRVFGYSGSGGVLLLVLAISACLGIGWHGNTNEEGKTV